LSHGGDEFFELGRFVDVADGSEQGGAGLSLEACEEETIAMGTSPSGECL
jgi:hypothetical protein